MTDLSVIIPSFNTREITVNCLKSLVDNLKKENNLRYEIIVVDNGSTDGTVETIKNLKLKIKNLELIANKKNVGFGAANNQGLKNASGKYILFLNSDTLVNNVIFAKLLKFLNDNIRFGGLTVKVNLTDDGIDPASHRGFPTVWNSFCYFFYLEKLFGILPVLGRIFGGYHLTYLDMKKIHEIDSPSGAFYLCRKSALDKVKGFDEAFFMYGEDLDLSFRIKEAGYKIIYYPDYEITHLKYSSGLRTQDFEKKATTKKHFYSAMRIFYKKHYEKSNNFLVNKIVYFLINLKEKFL